MMRKITGSIIKCSERRCNPNDNSSLLKRWSGTPGGFPATDNSLPFWPNQEAGVREIWRVLKSGK